VAKKSTIFTKSWDNCIYPSYLHTSNCNLNLGYLQSHIGHSLKQKSLGYLKHHTMSLHRYQCRHSESSSGHQSPPYRRSISWSDDEPPRHTRMRERRKRRRAHSTDQVSTGFYLSNKTKVYDDLSEMVETFQDFCKEARDAKRDLEGNVSFEKRERWTRKRRSAQNKRNVLGVWLSEVGFTDSEIRILRPVEGTTLPLTSPLVRHNQQHRKSRSRSTSRSRHHTYHTANSRKVRQITDEMFTARDSMHYLERKICRATEKRRIQRLETQLMVTIITEAVLEHELDGLGWHRVGDTTEPNRPRRRSLWTRQHTGSDQWQDEREAYTPQRPSGYDSRTDLPKQDARPNYDSNLDKTRNPAHIQPPLDVSFGRINPGQMGLPRPARPTEQGGHGFNAPQPPIEHSQVPPQTDQFAFSQPNPNLLSQPALPPANRLNPPFGQPGLTQSDSSGQNTTEFASHKDLWGRRWGLEKTSEDKFQLTLRKRKPRERGEEESIRSGNPFGRRSSRCLSTGGLRETVRPITGFPQDRLPLPAPPSSNQPPAHHEKASGDPLETFGRTFPGQNHTNGDFRSLDPFSEDPQFRGRPPHKTNSPITPYNQQFGDSAMRSGSTYPPGPPQPHRPGPQAWVPPHQPPLQHQRITPGRSLSRPPYQAPQPQRQNHQLWDRPHPPPRQPQPFDRGRSRSRARSQAPHPEHPTRSLAEGL